MTSVVVVGGGAAGLSAAVLAGQNGHHVTVVERSTELGGSSALAVGSITGSGTRRQRNAGILDNASDHFDDLVACLEDPRFQDDPAERWRLEILASASASAIDWLESVGVVFSGPHPEPPHRAMRMHNVVPDARALIDCLEAAAKRLGVDFLVGHEAVHLVTEGSAVVGVEMVSSQTSTKTFVPGSFTILGAGDASAAFGDRQGFKGVRAVNPNARGDAIKLAQEVGAAVFEPQAYVQLRSESAPYFRPSNELFELGASALDSRGRRITGDWRSYARELSSADPSSGYVVFDSRLASQIASKEEDSLGSRDGWFRNGKAFISTFPGIGYAYMRDMRGHGLLLEGESLRDLARCCGFDIDDFVEWQRLDSQAHEPPRSKERIGETSTMLQEPPFYALGPFAPSVVLSDGAVATDDRMHVLREDGSRVPGLLAAGSSAWGDMRISGHGQHLAWSVISGLRAATNLVEL